MRMQKPAARRSGAALVEAAIVLPVLLLLLYGIFCGAIMVITVDQVDAASREAARYASTRGTSYAFNTGNTAATASDITTYAQGQGVTLDSSKMTVSVSWDTSNRPGNYVTVQVVYDWPGLGPFPAQTFTATSTQMVTY
jgi:Flp pilus assembly protein TadG